MYIDERGRVNRWRQVETSGSARRRRPAPAPEPVRSRGGFFAGVLGLIKFLLKLAISPVAGTFLAGLIAAFLDANEIVRIDEDSPLLLGLILVCVILVWRFLSRVGPLKRRGA